MIFSRRRRLTLSVLATLIIGTAIASNRVASITPATHGSVNTLLEKAERTGRQRSQSLEATAVPSTAAAGCIDGVWMPTGMTNAPIGRFAHSVVWTGSEMIVWGGRDQNGTPLNTGARYNPNTDTWTPIVRISATFRPLIAT